MEQESFQDDEEIQELLGKYCPICQKVLIPINIDEVANGEDDGFIYVHDDIDHEESDIDALMNGIQ